MNQKYVILRDTRAFLISEVTEALKAIRRFVAGFRTFYFDDVFAHRDEVYQDVVERLTKLQEDWTAKGATREVIVLAFLDFAKGVLHIERTAQMAILNEEDRQEMHDQAKMHAEMLKAKAAKPSKETDLVSTPTDSALVN